MKIKKGDTIKVIAGKDKGKTGKVVQAFPKLNRVSVEGVNISYKHLRGQKGSQAGQKIEFPSPIHISNVKIADQGIVDKAKKEPVKKSSKSK